MPPASPVTDSPLQAPPIATRLPSLLAMVLAAMLALSGCASGTMRIYADMLEQAFSTPEDAEVSDEALANTPFAYSHVRLGDGPQSVLVLAYREFGEDKWVSARGEMLVMRQGRIVRTIGLATALLATTSATPDPIGRTVPDGLSGMSWSRTLDWAGEHGAGFVAESVFIDRGAVEVALRQGETRPARRIEERVTLQPGGVKFSNEFDFDPQGRVLRSRQHIHPSLPPLEFTLIRGLQEEVVPAETQADDTAPATGDVHDHHPPRVIVHRADGSRTALPPGPQQLETLLLAARDHRTTFWPAVRLYRVDAEHRAESEGARAALEARLERIATRHRAKGRLQEAAALERLVADLPPAPPGKRLELVLDLDQVRLEARLNKLMPPGEYLLIAPPRPAGLAVTGMIAGPGERDFVADRSVSTYIAGERLRKGAHKDYAWLVQPDGQLHKVPVALWNRERLLPLPGALLFVPPDAAVLDKDHEALASALARLHADQVGGWSP